jgi:hypothetical protein
MWVNPHYLHSHTLCSCEQTPTCISWVVSRTWANPHLHLLSCIKNISKPPLDRKEHTHSQSVQSLYQAVHEFTCVLCTCAKAHQSARYGMDDPCRGNWSHCAFVCMCRCVCVLLTMIWTLATYWSLIREITCTPFCLLLRSAFATNNECSMCKETSTCMPLVLLSRPVKNKHTSRV